jgi:hypothetical protein
MLGSEKVMVYLPIGTGVVIAYPSEFVSTTPVVTVTGAVIVTRSGNIVCDIVSVAPLITVLKMAGNTTVAEEVEGKVDGVGREEVVCVSTGSPPPPPTTASSVAVMVETAPAESVVVSKIAVKKEPSELVIVVSDAVKESASPVEVGDDASSGSAVYAHASGWEGSSKRGRVVSLPSQLQTFATVSWTELAQASRVFSSRPYSGKLTKERKPVDR